MIALLLMYTVSYSNVTNQLFCLGYIYIIDNKFHPPSDITAVPQYYTVHCVIAGMPQIFHYYYQNTVLNYHHCSSQTGYYCRRSSNDKATSNLTSGYVTDKIITVTWEAEEINTGAFRQDNYNGDHVIECHVTKGQATRVSNVTIRGN